MTISVLRAAALPAVLLLALPMVACQPASESSTSGNGANAPAANAPAANTAESGAADAGSANGTVSDSTPSDSTLTRSAERSLIVYSGRSQSLIGDLIDGFEEETGIDTAVRWGSTSEMAATLLEEGDATSADVFLAQDPGGLGAVAGQLAPLPQALLDRVDPRFRDAGGRWVGVTGRARTLVYNTERVDEAEVPADLWALTEPAWKGRVGWAPTNASFHAMVTAMRDAWGEDETRRWLEAMMENDAQVYDKNSPIVAAVGSGEVDAGLVNHYYLYRFLAEEGDDFPARNAFIDPNGPGSLVMVAGGGVLEGAAHSTEAEEFLAYMLSDAVQERFTIDTREYPLVPDVASPPGLPPLSDVAAPNVDLGVLADLEGTIALLREVGALP